MVLGQFISQKGGCGGYIELHGYKCKWRILTGVVGRSGTIEAGAGSSLGDHDELE